MAAISYDGNEQALQHIVRYYSSWQEENFLYIVMELCR